MHFDRKTLVNHSLQSFDEENLQIYNSFNTKCFFRESFLKSLFTTDLMSQVLPKSSFPLKNVANI